MEQGKGIYYVDLSSGEILPAPLDSSAGFRIFANGEELAELRALFTENYNDDMAAFARAHVPYLEYHHDPQNEAYDHSMRLIYAKLYELGDEEAKRHIEGMGILEESKHLDPEEIRDFK